jgi:rRNA maturation protein Rpf1
MAMFLPNLDKPEQRKAALYTTSRVNMLVFRDSPQQSTANDETIYNFTYHSYSSAQEADHHNTYKSLEQQAVIFYSFTSLLKLNKVFSLLYTLKQKT